MQNNNFKKIVFLITVAFSMTISPPSTANSQKGEHQHKSTVSPDTTIKAEILNQMPLVKGKVITSQLKLTDLSTGKPLLNSEIKITHTEKIHLLIFDNTLSDYQHVHPAPSDKPGVYTFNWTPRKVSHYRAWVGLTPQHADHEEYIIVNLGELKHASDPIKRTTNSTYTLGDKKFVLSFDEPNIESGKAAMGKVTVESQGQPFTQLEPVMGAYAHIIAINEDFTSLAHIHPMGVEPSNNSDRGGPELKFHMEPNNPGYWKIWVQVKIDGKELFVPFGVNVK